MYDIHVVLSNTPGALAVLGSLLGKNDISLEGGGVFTVGNESHAHFLVEDGEQARLVLMAAGLDVRDVVKPLIRKLNQERSGELGEIADAIARAGINIITQYSDHHNHLILLTDNNELATNATIKWDTSSE
ncbi:amino acid-binding protein [Xenorhabdus bharatensis]|uniref:amino acid-binding protein n=1 Tax=Xenorhabdus bharatensis TaxID=3136256 RepID=UPI0030F4802A